MRSVNPNCKLEWTMLGLLLYAIVLLLVRSATGNQVVSWILYGLLGCIAILLTIRMLRNLKTISRVGVALETAGEAYYKAAAHLEAQFLVLYQIPWSDRSAVNAALNKIAEADGACDRARVVLEEKLREFRSLPRL